MEVITNTAGKAIGQVSVQGTIATMEVGEVWLTDATEVSVSYVTSCCSKYGTKTGKQFHVSSPKEAAGQITIRRIK